MIGNYAKTYEYMTEGGDNDYYIHFDDYQQFKLLDSAGNAFYMSPSRTYRVVISSNISVTANNPILTCISYRPYVIFGATKYYIPLTGGLDIVVSGVNNGHLIFGVELDYVNTFPGSTASKASVSVKASNIQFYCQPLSFVQDSVTKGEQQIQGSIDKGNQLQQEANTLQEEANQTSKNIFQKISDFFAGFFEGIINAFKSLFIPEDGYFSEYFTRLNNFFSDKLGMLYAPIDMFVGVLTGISNASSSDAGIPFPGLKWGDTYIIEPQTISLASIAGQLPGLQEKIYFVTDIIMVGAVLLLLQNKLKEVLNR